MQCFFPDELKIPNFLPLYEKRWLHYFRIIEFYDHYLKYLRKVVYSQLCIYRILKVIHYSVAVNMALEKDVQPIELHWN